jgi:cell division protein FtsQ
VAWLVLIAYLVYGLMFSSKRANGVVCKSIEVEVLDSTDYQFVKSATIKRMLTSAKKNLIGQPLKGINTKVLEDEISAMVAVRDVQVYKSLDGKLRITVNQRRPIVRVFNAADQSYYIDDQGLIMPTSYNYTAHVLVVSGNIKEPFKVKPNENVLAWNDSIVRGEKPTICRIYDFAKYVSEDDFWNAQIAQVYVNNLQNVELIPVVGPHVVQLGGFRNFRIKLKKLMAFYKEALPTEGWNKYKIINLKYSNQIVCTKR